MDIMRFFPGFRIAMQYRRQRREGSLAKLARRLLQKPAVERR
jgi:hypothetical protein